MKSRHIFLIHQEGALKSYFPDSKIKRWGDSRIEWTGKVKPTPLSATYTLHLDYEKEEGVAIYVQSPLPLKLAEGESSLPHVYSQKKQKLCLYYPKALEWDSSMYYVHTIIPWACEWLMHYEIWLGTGKWKGGGIEHN